MFESPKRRRPEVTSGSRGHEEVKFRDVTLYLVERRMGKSRRTFLSNLARSKGFCVDDSLSGGVTHVVSEGNAAQDLWMWLEDHGLSEAHDTHVLTISWFTESMSAGRPLPVEMRHHIQNPAVEQRSSSSPAPKPVSTVSPFACQRRTTLDNHNKNFTDLLEVLAENMELSGNQGPCLAFRRAASVLKSLNTALRHPEEMKHLPCLGEHSKAIIEVEYLSLSLSLYLSSALRTSENWFSRGLRTLEQILSDPTIRLNRMQTAGFLFYDDISRPVSRAEAEAMKVLVEDAVKRVNPSARVCITGGFRRGKDFGHDVDFIIRTPEPGQEDGLLPALIDWFRRQNVLLYADLQESTFDLGKLPSRRFESMDHFHKCFLIVKLKRDDVCEERERDEDGRRDWRAIRVDLVAPPIERYAYALLGWTGSTLFDRDLRRFARLERGKLLDNHALYDKATKAKENSSM
ncbi:DNA nucleotidylexotransferase [Triplophysa tibetana]|uniref:DNA nucleotidylexotransferase n=1 Tax=Triplophysa tibetana TaxID=1572043 RepID=A0A5A9P908_9TELE|nr:DNA nucleotidylexotransferase [Triplophysa tibetana]